MDFAIENGNVKGNTGESTGELFDRTVELHTLVGHRASESGVYLRDTDLSKKTYSWDEYKKITSEASEWALIYITERYHEIEGPETPEIKERNVRLSDDLIVVEDGHFAGCVFEREVTYCVEGQHHSYTSLVLLRPGAEPVLIQSFSGDPASVAMYDKTNAVLRKYDHVAGE